MRTPLTAILGFSDLSERAAGGRLEERERCYLASVRDGGEHLLRLVNNLLDQIRLEQGRMEVHLEEVELASMLDSVVSLMEGFALRRSARVEVRRAGAQAFGLEDRVRREGGGSGLALVGSARALLERSGLGSRVGR